MPPHPLATAPTHRHRRHHQAAAVVGSRVCSGQPAPPSPLPPYAYRAARGAARTDTWVEAYLLRTRAHARAAVLRSC